MQPKLAISQEWWRNRHQTGNKIRTTFWPQQLKRNFRNHSKARVIIHLVEEIQGMEELQFQAIHLKGRILIRTSIFMTLSSKPSKCLRDFYTEANIVAEANFANNLKNLVPSQQQFPRKAWNAQKVLYQGHFSKLRSQSSIALKAEIQSSLMANLRANRVPRGNSSNPSRSSTPKITSADLAMLLSHTVSRKKKVSTMWRSRKAPNHRQTWILRIAEMIMKVALSRGLMNQ